MIVSVQFTPDSNYNGVYNLKVYKLPSNVIAFNKSYNPPYSVDIIENITISGISNVKVNILAVDCEKIVYTSTQNASTYCGIPVNLRANSITESTVTLNWTTPSNGAPSGGYKYEIYEGSTLVTSGTTSTNSKTITLLTGSTSYTAYVKAICGTDVYGTAASINFTTTA